MENTRCPSWKRSGRNTQNLSQNRSRGHPLALKSGRLLIPKQGSGTGSYLDLKLNNGYSDGDFDAKNSQYKFP